MQEAPIRAKTAAWLGGIVVYSTGILLASALLIVGVIAAWFYPGPHPDEAALRAEIGSFLNAMARGDAEASQKAGANWPAGVTTASLAAGSGPWGHANGIAVDCEDFFGRWIVECTGEVDGTDGTRRSFHAHMEKADGRWRIKTFNFVGEFEPDLPSHPAGRVPELKVASEGTPAIEIINGSPKVKLLLRVENTRHPPGEPVGNRFSVNLRFSRKGDDPQFDSGWIAAQATQASVHGVWLAAEFPLPEGWVGATAEYFIRVSDSLEDSFGKSSPAPMTLRSR